MAKKIIMTGILVITLVFGIMIAGCGDGGGGGGPLGGTVWTRSASSTGTGSGNGFESNYELKFEDGDNATIKETGWTMFNNKKTTVNTTDRYTYVYNSPSARKGALTPSKGTSGIGMLFEISADGKTLSSESANTGVGYVRHSWALKSGSVPGSGSSGGSNSGGTSTADIGSIKIVNNSGKDINGGTISGADYKAIPYIAKSGNTTITGLSVGTYTVEVRSSIYYWKKTGVKVTKGGTATVTVSSSGWGL